LTIKKKQAFLSKYQQVNIINIFMKYHITSIFPKD